MSHKIRKLLLAPLVYTAAILLLCEEWLWTIGKRLLARLPVIPFIARLEFRISQFRPYTALAVFTLPGLLLLPVKILALLSITHGHPALGLLVVISAKMLGTALVARLYVLTRGALLSLPWFARGQTLLLGFKDRMIGQLRATGAWRYIETLRAGLMAARPWRRLWVWLRHGQPVSGSTEPGSRLGRMIKKMAAMRRRKR